jgi:tricorn protease-like protein
LPGVIKQDGNMKYTIGANVRFRLESGEVHEGNIQYIENSKNEEIYYINSFSRWAYKIPENKIIS